MTGCKPHGPHIEWIIGLNRPPLEKDAIIAVYAECRLLVSDVAKSEAGKAALQRAQRSLGKLHDPSVSEVERSWTGALGSQGVLVFRQGARKARWFLARGRSLVRWSTA